MNVMRLNMVILLTLCMPASFASANDFMKQLDNFSGSFNSQITSPAINVASSPLSDSDVISGLKEALNVGSHNVVAQLSKSNGFHSDPAIHIPLPKQLNKVKSALSSIGQSKLMDELELTLNRAAEAAAPKTKKIFAQAIHDMTFDDANQILKGPDNAATQYFKGKMSSTLTAAIQPVVKEALSQAGAVQAYDKALGKYQSLPFVPNVKADLTQHAVKFSLRGIFYYLAKEETAIRKDPVKRTTEILRKVFEE